MQRHDRRTSNGLEVECIAMDITVLEKGITKTELNQGVKLGAICNPQIQKKHLESLESFADIIGLVLHAGRYFRRGQ